MIPDKPDGESIRQISNIAPDAKLRGYVLTAMFAGIAAAAGYMLMLVPNIEAVTAILFTAGYVLGFRRGILAALIAAVLYFGLNPQGGLFPPLLAAQILGVALAPILGVYYRLLNPQGVYRYLCLALAALTATLWYDFLTNLAFPLSVGLDMKGILIMLTTGIPFSLIHIAGNIAIFIILVPLFIGVLNKQYKTG